MTCIYCGSELHGRSDKYCSNSCCNGHAAGRKFGRVGRPRKTTLSEKA